MGADTRSRIIDASERLFRRQGYAGVGMKQVVEQSAAPLGSIYHFFPGGKLQLCSEAVTASGRVYGALIAQIFDPAPDPATAIIAFFEGAAAVLEATGYEDACPIAVIALEAASTSEPLRIATRDVFRSWLDLLVERYLAAGIVDDQARDLALLSLSTLEGAFILARAERSVAPMHACGRLVGSLIRAALPAGRAEV